MCFIYLIAVEQTVCGVQQCACLCVLLCSIAQLCVCMLQRFHVNREGGIEGKELLVNRLPVGQVVNLQRVDERLSKAEERDRYY